MMNAFEQVAFLAMANFSQAITNVHVENLKPIVDAVLALAAHEKKHKEKDLEREWLQKQLFESKIQLEQQKKQLSDALSEKNLLLANVSHDLRTPLHCIM